MSPSRMHQIIPSSFFSIWKQRHGLGASGLSSVSWFEFMILFFPFYLSRSWSGLSCSIRKRPLYFSLSLSFSLLLLFLPTCMNALYSLRLKELPLLHFLLVGSLLFFFLCRSSSAFQSSWLSDGLLLIQLATCCCCMVDGVRCVLVDKPWRKKKEGGQSRFSGVEILSSGSVYLCKDDMW